jgi:glycerophosphoryl diester phosphodiesterase
VKYKQIAPSRLARSVIDAGMERQVVIFASPDVLRAVRATLEGSRLALMCKWRPDASQLINELHPAAVEINAADVTAERLQSLHAIGIKVEARTLGTDDRAEVWDRMIAAGADWLQTDRAEEIVAREAIRRIGKKPVMIAHHRGANRYAPENTLPAYEKSVALGADFVEFDVRTTKDGAFFLLHDGKLDRTTNARGPIAERTASEIASLDAGTWFGRSFAGTPAPTLDAFLTAIGDRSELYFDAKEITPEALVAALRAHNLTDRAVVYQGVDYLERLRKIEPRIRRMPPLGNLADLDKIVTRVAPYAFDTRWSILSKDLITRCHEKGIKVFSDALGLNETIPSYQRAIRDGIDLIQTDDPLRVLRAIELLEPSPRP